jgi:hypothetical protein
MSGMDNARKMAAIMALRAAQIRMNGLSITV